MNICFFKWNQFCIFRKRKLSSSPLNYQIMPELFLFAQLKVEDELLFPIQCEWEHLISSSWSPDAWVAEHRASPIPLATQNWLSVASCPIQCSLVKLKAKGQAWNFWIQVFLSGKSRCLKLSWWTTCPFFLRFADRSSRNRRLSYTSGHNTKTGVEISNKCSKWAGCFGYPS